MSNIDTFQKFVKDLRERGWTVDIEPIKHFPVEWLEDDENKPVKPVSLDISFSLTPPKKDKL